MIPAMKHLGPLLASLLLALPASAADPPTDPVLAASVRVDARGRQSSATFSGTLVDSDHLVITSAHAIGCVDELVVTAAGHELDARVALLDDGVDLAVLSIKPKRSMKLQALSVGIPPGPGATVQAWGAASGLRAGPVRRVQGGTVLARLPSALQDLGGPVVHNGGLVGVVVGWQPGRDDDDPRSAAVGARSISAVLERADPDARVSRKTLCAGAREVWTELRDATIHLEQGNLEAAETLLGLALGRDLDEDLRVRLRLLRARVRVTADKLEPAIIDLTAALELQPENPEALAARGLARNTVGRHEAALRDLDEAIQHDPDDLRAWITRAQILYDLGDKEQAEEAVRGWATAGGRDADGLALLCRLHLDRAGYDEANSSCKAALASGWSEPRVFIDRARQQREAGDLGGALRTLDAGLEGGLVDLDARYERAILRLHFDRVDDALADAVVVTDGKPDHGPAWYARAYALGRLGRPADAIAAAKRAAELGQPGAEELVSFLKAGGQPGRLQLQ